MITKLSSYSPPELLPYTLHIMSVSLTPSLPRLRIGLWFSVSLVSLLSLLISCPTHFHCRDSKNYFPAISLPYLSHSKVFQYRGADSSSPNTLDLYIHQCHPIIKCQNLMIPQDCGTRHSNRWHQHDCCRILGRVRPWIAGNFHLH